MNDKSIHASAFGFSPLADAETNRRALQAAIKEAHTVKVSVPGVYDISGTIRIPSDTHLRFSEHVVLRRIPLKDTLSEGYLFVNEGAFTGVRNENISIDGAHIVVNGVESAAISSDDDPETILHTPNVVTGLRAQMAFLSVRNLTIQHVLITDLLSKDYGIQVSDFEDVVIENIHIEGRKDGVHFGPGKRFLLRNGRFRTDDDAIALNCADYAVSNPNWGSISNGLIENCVELPGGKSGLFIRVLVGTAREWTKGMTVFHSDAVRTETGLYRVVMKPDGRPYVSKTKPCFHEGCRKLDGILWLKTNQRMEEETRSLFAGCSDLTFRNIILENPRNRAVLIYRNNDAYLRSWYPGSELPPVRNLRFENVQVLKPVDRFLCIETQAEQITLHGGTVSETDVFWSRESETR